MGDVDEGNADAHFYRGFVNDNLKNYNKAITDYSRAIELHSEHSAEAYGKRGFLKFKIADYTGAMDDYNKAIELNPINKDYYLHRGQLKIKLGQKDGGRLDLNKYKKSYKKFK